MIEQTFFFYDLETSGLNPRHQRVMQFAGQRTDLNLNPLGEPVDSFVQLPEDILPDPGAVLITGTTPQKSREEGITEPEFAKLVSEQVFTPGTIAVGFNTVRFDDEFMRHTLWRNFYDPYEWTWSDGRSRWDMLDVVRMTRALRPDGVMWPVDESGASVNKLELLSKVNNLEHTHAHDALSDVEATIGVAKLIKSAQPKLFDYLLKMRGKKEIASLINLDDPKPFVYSTGRYGKKHDFTSVAFPIAPGTRPGTVLVYDLRYDPTPFLQLTKDEIKKKLFAPFAVRKKDDFVALPVKELAYNKCPAVAPLGVLDGAAYERLELTQSVIQVHMQMLTRSFSETVSAAFSERDPYVKDTDVEGQLYDSFIDNSDKNRMSVIRASGENELADFHPDFVDGRFEHLLLRYKARFFPKTLSEDEQVAWQEYRQQKFEREAPQFIKELEKCSGSAAPNAKFLIEEMKLWLEATAPID